MKYPLILQLKLVWFVGKSLIGYVLFPILVGFSVKINHPILFVPRLRQLINTDVAFRNDDSPSQPGASPAASPTGCDCAECNAMHSRRHSVIHLHTLTRQTDSWNIGFRHWWAPACAFNNVAPSVMWTWADAGVPGARKSGVLRWDIWLLQAS